MTTGYSTRVRSTKLSDNLDGLVKLSENLATVRRVECFT
nr:MAG TPA: hypothetical protein [Caudoviricetes sp.]